MRQGLRHRRPVRVPHSGPDRYFVRPTGLRPANDTSAYYTPYEIAVWIGRVSGLLGGLCGCGAVFLYIGG